jgi:hypothetical protein
MLSNEVKAIMMAQLLTPAFHAWGGERCQGSIEGARVLVESIAANLAKDAPPAIAAPVADRPQNNDGLVNPSARM